MVSILSSVVLAGCAVEDNFVYKEKKGTDWRLAGETLDRTQKFFIDANSIEGNKMRTAWGLMIKDKCKKNDEYCEQQTRDLYNCESKEQKLIYLVSRKNGDVIHSIDFKDKTDWNPIVPDSVGEGILNFVCSFKIQ